MALLRQCLNEVRLRWGEAGVLAVPATAVRSGSEGDALAAAARPSGRTGPSGVTRDLAVILLPAPRLH